MSAGSLSFLLRTAYLNSRFFDFESGGRGCRWRSSRRRIGRVMGRIRLLPDTGNPESRRDLWTGRGYTWALSDLEVLSLEGGGPVVEHGAR